MEKHLYLLIHTHRFGVDTWPFYATEEKFNSLSPEKIALGLGVDYEGEGTKADRDDEWVEAVRLDSDPIPTIE